jgi:V/A-type H+-transporting ATPase subunit A
VICLGNHGNSDAQGRKGSVSVVGAVSPPGGDFSEPVTQNSMRVASTFWALDYDLSRRRHFPAINWTSSYSLYNFSDWFEREVAPDWDELSREAMALLQREVELLEIVQLVGPDALAERERAVLAIARMLREDFLQQMAYGEADRYCSIHKTYWMLKTIIDFYHHTQAALDAQISLERVTTLSVAADIARMKEFQMETAEKEIKAIMDRVQFSFADLGVD